MPVLLAEIPEYLTRKTSVTRLLTIAVLILPVEMLVLSFHVKAFVNLTLFTFAGATGEIPIAEEVITLLPLGNPKMYPVTSTMAIMLVLLPDRVKLFL